MITTLTQSLGTFLFVSAMFAILLIFMHIPIYLAFAFGGIALATALLQLLPSCRNFIPKDQ